jgi:hypothetical protein|tara:strand:+ start:358 stop:558 length:201 start_codon:yes stop_codon:yes gene_type:complete
MLFPNFFRTLAINIATDRNLRYKIKQHLDFYTDITIDKTVTLTLSTIKFLGEVSKIEQDDSIPPYE